RMGQLLVTQAAHPALVDKIWRRAVALMARLAGNQPCDEVKQDCLRAAKFPKLAGLSSGFCRETASGRWIAGAGTWFYDRVSGSAALERLCSERVEDASDSVLKPLDGSFVLLTGCAGDDS